MLVDKIEATDPISVLHLSMPLYIVLPSGEVPHEITPIHVVQLIIEEESEILGKSGFHDRFGSFGSSHLYRTTFKISPLFICRYMFRFIAIHTREQHVQLGLILVMFVISGDYITVYLVLRCFQFFLPNGFALCRYGSPVGITSDFGRESLSIEQRPVAILFAVEITAQTKYIFGRILIHRGIGRRTNHNQRIRRITDKNNEQRQQYRIHGDYRQLFTSKQIISQRSRKDNTDNIPVADKRNTHQYDTYQKRNLDELIAALSIRLINGPSDNPDNEEEIKNHSAVERQVENVDEQQFDPTGNLDKPRDQTVKQKHDQHERYQQGN